MKKLPVKPMPRIVSSMRRVARSRTDTATDLVRLEFEAARLERELAQVRVRQDRSEKALVVTRRRIGDCLGKLDLGEEAP